MESLVFKTQSERNIGKQRRSRSCGNYLNFGCTDFTCRYIQISAHESGRDDFREDYKREQRYLKGEVTVYLSLVFILLISFAGAMLESASLQNVKNYRRADMTRAVESIFAEYQKELWEVYGIFALEGSYETGSYSEELLKERLAYYGASGMDQEITRIQLLTDQGASAFYEQVTAYMENKYGLDKVKKLVGQTDTWKAGEEALQNYERDGAKTEQELQELLSQKEEFPEEENPLSHVAKLKSMPLVDLIMPKGRVMSKKSITLSEMVSHRKRNQGYGDFSDVAGSGSTISKLLFIYSILYKPCIFKAYRLLNVQTLCIFPCFCPYEPKQGKFLFSADYLIQQSCGSTLRFPCSVSVNVHCGTDISVSEKFLHIFRCCTV